MGRTILCNECHSTFDEDILKKKNSENKCLVCGASLGGGNSSDHMESPSFRDGIEDYNNPDLYYYDIDEPEEYSDDLRDVWCQCTLCKTVNIILYNKFDVIKSEYLRLKNGLDLKCKGCGKQISNKIVPKRPDGWRNLNLLERANIPKCPVCNSTKIHKISMTNKAVSALTFGIFAAGHVSKTYKCDICGSKF